MIKYMINNHVLPLTQETFNAPFPVHKQWKMASE